MARRDEDPVLRLPRHRSGFVSALHYVGIDSGLRGALACIDDRMRVVKLAKVPTFRRQQPDGEYVTVYDLPRVAALLFGLPRVRFALIERQQAYPDPPGCKRCSCIPCRSKPHGGRGGQGTVSAFTTGVGFGLWQMALTTAEIEWQDIPPQTWKKAIGVLPPSQRRQRGAPQESAAEHRARMDERRKEAKRLAVERAQGLFPGVRLVPPGARVPSPDLAEALLLAVLARSLATNGHA